MSNNGEQEVFIYVVTNRTTGEKSYQPATNAQDACQQAGWLIGDCYVVTLSPRYKPVPDHDPLVLVKLPCQICPYQWAECKKPAGGECPCRREMPDLKEWLAEVTKSHLCEFVGEELAKTDYRQGQKWLPIAQAIKELSPQH